MRRQQKSIMVLAMIAVFIATMTFFPTQINAGSLEPSESPGPTMKTLDEIPPTWSQKLPVSERFVFVLDGAAVLDKETGLVWERSPDTTRRPWYLACWHCYQREVDGRKGWRPPTLEELTSLVDSANTNPSLPTNHPFSNVSSDFYWSSTTTIANSGSAWQVYFAIGGINEGNKVDDFPIWCVRGGHGHDAY